MLNPSTADETANDPTIHRCETRARRWGFGGMRAVNLFAYRATHPRDLKHATAPTGPSNAQALRDAADWGDVVLAAWGVHGAYLGAGPACAARLWADGIALQTLGVTKDGHPRHPLYVAYAQDLEEWRAPHPPTPART